MLKPLSPRVVKPTQVRVITRLPASGDRDLSEPAALFRDALKAVVADRKV
jgi:hypothetical protein